MFHYKRGTNDALGALLPTGAKGTCNRAFLRGNIDLDGRIIIILIIMMIIINNNITYIYIYTLYINH